MGVGGVDLSLRIQASAQSGNVVRARLPGPKNLLERAGCRPPVLLRHFAPRQLAQLGWLRHTAPYPNLEVAIGGAGGIPRIESSTPIPAGEPNDAGDQRRYRRYCRHPPDEAEVRSARR